MNRWRASISSDDSEDSTAILDSMDALRQKRNKFETQYAEHKAFTKTFWQRAFEIMETMHWNSAVFCELTLLNEMTYSRAKTDSDTIPDVRTVMAICAGLDLDISLTIDMLALAGHVFTNSREDQAYVFIITSYKGTTIHERNEFLISLDLQPLGSKQRK